MSTESGHSRYSFGSFEFDAQSQSLLRGGEAVPLKPKVCLLLNHLLEHRDRLVTRAELMDRLWPNQDVADSSLTQSVYELRKALGDKRDSVTYIETVARRGFRFKAPVIDASAARSVAAPQGARIASIAVLPFTALPGVERDEALEHGVAASLIATLSKIPDLTVRQVGGLPKYSEAGRDALAAARDLSVDVVLDGTLQRAGKQLRVTAQLVRVSDETVLWADRFDQSLSDIFAMEDAICDRVVGAIATELPAGVKNGLSHRHTADVEVHELFLRCRYYWHKWTPDSWQRSIECGRAAVARDPLHAPSYAWMAASYCTLGIAGIIPPIEAFGEAQHLVDRALALDEDYGDAYQTRGAIEHFHRWNWAAAERHLTHAFALNPSGGEGRGLYALLLAITNRPDEALSEVERARDADPLSLIVNTGVGEVYLYRGELSLAAQALQHTLSLDRYFANARFTLADVYAAQGRHAESLAEMELAVAHAGIPREASPHIGYALALNGDHDEARRIRDALIALSERQFVDPYGIALVNVGLGDLDEAFRWFDAAVDARSCELVYLGANAIFNHLHSDPRFKALKERVGLPVR